MSVPIQKLTEFFGAFPGIGPRQAKRFVYHLLKQDHETLDSFVNTLRQLKDDTVQCPDCFRYFSAGGHKKDGDCCDICRDINVDDSLLMIVEKDVDLETIRRSGVYGGRFFVLGGLVPILEKNPSLLVRSKELFNKILNTCQPPVNKSAETQKLTEVIIALSANPDGDNTVDYLRPILKPLEDKFGFKVTILGRGLSTGTEIEYSDRDTLANALKNRN